jgi:hypothetical protein
MAQIPDLQKLDSMIARFAPARITADTARLDAGDQKALAKMLEAAHVIDELYLEQAWSGNFKLRAELRKDRSELGKARLHYFEMNKGPWSALDGNTAFLPGVPAHKLPGANFYPEDMTKAEFEKWAPSHPGADGFFSVIRRKGKTLEAVPYSKAYSAQLKHAAGLLREAAALTTNASLKKFLQLRADAFLNDDYFASDVAWMDLDAPIELTIGPYETYTDELFGYKAAFECYVTLRDDAETAKIHFFSSHLQEVEDHLPIDPKYRNPKIGALAPLRVVNELIATGDGAHGVRTAAFNLPNDERVIQQKGSKRVMLKNVQEAKFEKTLIPLSKVALPADQQKDLSFDSFFTHIVAHELSHGLGPHNITVNGRATTPRQELKELYSAMEEAKADVTGLFMLQHLYDRGLAFQGSKEDAERKLYTTYLASSFRSVRFGLNEAHGKGMALQFNYLLGKEAIRITADGRFEVDLAKIKAAVTDLTHDLLTIEAEGDYARAKQMLTQYAEIRPALANMLKRMVDIPTDIWPL